MQAICKGNRDLVSLLKSPVVNADKKDKILDAITAGRIGLLAATFNKLMIRKGREGYLPEVIDAFIHQYKVLSGIHTVKTDDGHTDRRRTKEDDPGQDPLCHGYAEVGA